MEIDMEKSKYKNVVENLMRLDSESFLLVSSGVELLLARQNMNKGVEESCKEEQAFA